MALSMLIQKAREARPDLPVDDVAFLRWLTDGSVDVDEAALGNAGDLLLAFLCGENSPPALAVLEREVIARLKSRSATETDDVRQEVRTALLVPREGAPKRISLYRGKSSLLAWVRVIAGRSRPRSTTAYQVESSDEPSPSSDPERLLASHQSNASFRFALQRAAEELTTVERSLLVAHFLHGQTLDELARHHCLGRATVTRRLSGACAVLRGRLAEAGESAGDVEAPRAESLARLLVAAPSQRFST